MSPRWPRMNAARRASTATCSAGRSSPIENIDAAVARVRELGGGAGEKQGSPENAHSAPCRATKAGVINTHQRPPLISRSPLHVIARLRMCVVLARLKAAS